MKDKKFIKGLAMGILLSAVIWAGGSLILDSKPLVFSRTSTGKVAPDSRTASKKLAIIEDMIDEMYLDEVEEGKLTESMYAGMINGLGDPYSRYYTAEEYASMMEETEGGYEGIGVVMQQEKESGYITVVRCYEGTPGAEAGMLPGDTLYKIDNQEVTGMELADVADLIRKSEGKTVHIVLVREGEPDYIELDVEKRHVEIPSVSYEMLENQVGYISIFEFTEVTAKQYKAAFENLTQQGMERLVIDLRGNPGGLLTSVCEILDSMLPKGLIVYTEDKDGNKDEYKSKGKTPIEIPLAVLINGSSASAAEIFAGAIQDYGIGKLVGTTTYGKGIVQKIVPLEDGSAVKLTISKYYTPKGKNIHKTGIAPDVEVKLDESLSKKAAVTKEEDNQLLTALEVIS